MAVSAFSSILLRARRVLRPLVLGASLSISISAVAQAQAGLFAPDCAVKEITVITLIEDHGAAEDVPADRLSDAAQTMLRARSVCYEGRVSEALTLYQSVFDLGPLASLRARQR